MLDAKTAREELKSILNQKEYRAYTESKGLIATWWERAKGWLVEKLAALFPSITIGESAAASILIIVLAAALLLLAAAVFLLLRNQKRNRMLRKQKPLQSRKELDWTYTEHLQEAQRLEDAGDYSRSSRHLFLALLLFFNEKGWLAARIWKTNWEYYDELRKENARRAGQFNQLAHFFDEVTYGEREVAETEYRNYYHMIMNELREEGGEYVEKG